MPNRRQFLIITAGLVLAAGRWPGALAQGSETATAFVASTGEKLVAVVNGPGTLAEKRRQLTQIVDAAVDVDTIAQFCLGRFWRQATPAQQKSYSELFHRVLVTNITAKVGEYKGVKFTIGRSRPQDDDEIVSSLVERPNNPPTNVDWVISNPTRSPKIIDVLAEGTSLRLTQRSDYASYLSHNNYDINALITAMRQQAEQNKE
jgi:phospholipid transport system substrate-binding protein